METIRNNKAAETILEFNKIKEIWKGYAMTDGAKEAIEGAAPILSESQVLARLRETTEARDMIQRSGQPPLVSLSGIREWMRLAEIGGCLTAEQTRWGQYTIIFLLSDPGGGSRPEAAR